MSGQTLEQISKYWIKEILSGEQSVPLDRLSDVEMPEHLREDLIRHGEAVLEDEINRIYDSPFLRRVAAPGQQDPREQIRGILNEMMVLPSHALERIVQRTFRDVLDHWRSEPVSLRMAEEDSDSFAENVFNRCTTFVPTPEGDFSFGVDVISQVCEASGLGPLGRAVRCEEELGATELNRAQFARITQRFLMMKKRYRVSRKMISFEGTGRTLMEEPVVQPAEPTTVSVDELVAPTAPKPKPEPKPKPAAEKAAPVKPVPAPEPAKKQPMSFLDLEPETPMPGKEAAAEAEVAEGELEIPKEVRPENVGLYKKLTTPDIIEEFGDTLFDEDHDAYLNMLRQVCRQGDWASARIMADNELFLNNIEVTNRKAIKFFDILRDYYTTKK